MNNRKLFLGDLNHMLFNLALASSVGVKNGTITSRAVPVVHLYDFFF